MRIKGFCSALLRCGEIKLISEKREYAVSEQYNDLLMISQPGVQQ